MSSHTYVHRFEGVATVKVGQDDVFCLGDRGVQTRAFTLSLSVVST